MTPGGMTTGPGDGNGPHNIALSCVESVPDLSLNDLAISAIAVTNADLG